MGLELAESVLCLSLGENQKVELLNLGLFLTCLGAIVAIIIALVANKEKLEKNLKNFWNRLFIGVGISTVLSVFLCSPCLLTKLGLWNLLVCGILAVILLIDCLPKITGVIATVWKKFTNRCRTVWQKFTDWIATICHNFSVFLSRKMFASSSDVLSSVGDEIQKPTTEWGQKLAGYDTSISEISRKFDELDKWKKVLKKETEKKISEIDAKVARYVSALESSIKEVADKNVELENKILKIAEILDRHRDSLKTESRRVLNIDGSDVAFRLCPSGEFIMGSPLTGEEVVTKYPTVLDASCYEDAPQHRVILTHDFYLAERLVTKGEFKRFVEATGYRTTVEAKGPVFIRSESGDWKYYDKGDGWRDPGFEQTDEHPVVGVSYDDALAYIEWLNENFVPDSFVDGFKFEFRLPTEAEWEYACRAGTTTEFFWGDEEKDGKDYLNAAGTENNPGGEPWEYHFSFDCRYSATSPVGSFKANPWGLYDMLGNAWEWTSDFYGDYPEGIVTDPTDARDDSFRVLRGGACFSAPACCRCAFRGRHEPVGRCIIGGFRVAFSLTKE